MTETLVVRSQVKKIIGNIDLAADVMPELNKQVKATLEKAVERAKLNNRKTLMARDI